MNNHAYCLVFNCARGMLMAVSEAVKSQGKSTSETKANKTAASATGIRQSGSNSFSRTYVNRVAGLYVTGDVTGAGTLVATAGNDLNLMAAVIQNTTKAGSANTGSSTTATTNTGSSTLRAGNDLTLGIVEIAAQNNSVRNAKNTIKHGSTQEVGTTIQTQGDITLVAGNDLNAKAATVASSDGAITGIAGQDITIEAGTATSNMATARYKKKSGTFSTKKTTTRDTFNNTTSIASTLSADSISLTAGLAAANVSSGATTQDLAANTSAIILSEMKSPAQTKQVGGTPDNTGNINITASQDTHEKPITPK